VIVGVLANPQSAKLKRYISNTIKALYQLVGLQPAGLGCITTGAELPNPATSVIVGHCVCEQTVRHAILLG